MNKRNSVPILILVFLLLLTGGAFAQNSPDAFKGPSPTEAFDNPNLYSAKQLYKLSRHALASGNIKAARLFALRLFFDGKRSKNLLNLLGVIELQAKRHLLASIWFRKSLGLGLKNKIAHKYLTRLPGKNLPIPVDPTLLADHFTKITEQLPDLVSRLKNSKLHFNSIMKALSRGQIYLALALSEEYEKNFPGPDGQALTALCAWYLGRNKDALQIIGQTLTNSPHHPLLLFVKAMIADNRPGSSSASYLRALYDLDKWKTALKIAPKYSKIFPKSADGYILQARIMLDLHRVKQAGIAIQEAGKREPGNPVIDLLWVEYFLQKKDPQKAAKRLNKAFRRGYNLPSVSLTAGLFAIQAGRLNEVNVILNDAISNRPFTDPEAYPLYISLLLMTDNVVGARAAIDEWQTRFPRRSMFCYLEALYDFKTGDNIKAIDWLKKGFKLNPNRLGILQFLSGFPALADDPYLAAKINNRLARAKVKGFKKMKVPEPSKPKPVIKSAKPEAKTSVVSKGQFKIRLGNTIPQSGRELIETELERIYNRVTAYIGGAKDPIFINLVSADGMGSIIARYEPQNSGVTVTSLFFDPDAIQGIAMSNFNAFGDAEMNTLVAELPSHTLTRELIQLIIQAVIPKAKTSLDQTAWMQIGLGEALGGSQKTLRYRLLIAGESTTKKLARLASINMLNSIFAEGYSSPAVLETAYAQAYLMTCFLIKKTGSFERGCKAMMELIKVVSAGKDFDKALKEIFKISASDFEAGWKSAAYFAITQGSPYEW